MVNLTFMDNATSFVDVIIGVNAMTNQLFIPVILSILYFILLGSISSRTQNIQDAAIVSSFSITILTILAFALEMVADYIVIIPIILLGASILIKLIKKQ